MDLSTTMSWPWAMFLQSAGDTPSALWSTLPFLLIFVIFYFLLFLPMQRQRKQQQKMLAELAAGQAVVTTGGIIGTIVSVNADDTVVIRVKPDNLKLQISRSAIQALVTEEKEKK